MIENPRLETIANYPSGDGSESKPPRHTKTARPETPVLEGIPRLSTTRRDLGKAAAAGAVMISAGAAARLLEQPGDDAQPVPEDKIIPGPETPEINYDTLQLVGFPEVFEDENAQSIAHDHGLSTTKFVEGGYELSEVFDGFKDTELLPIFHPKVYEYKDLYYEMAEKHAIPVNFIAFLASVESGGNPEAGSGKAVGLFQLNPDFYAQGMGKDEWSQPENIAEDAASAMQLSLASARDYLGLPEDDTSPNVFIRAAAMYNAGPTGGAKEYDALALETQQYMHHARRFMQVAEVASDLRDMGYTNRDIVESLCSPAVDRRAFAVSYYDGPLDLDEMLRYLSRDPIEAPQDEEARALYNLYQDYDNPYTLPMNAWLRLHTSMNAGFVLGNSEMYQDNNVAENYFSIDTAKTE